ncbi:hypothetical protein GCM10027215_34740 [Nocardioides zeae]
MRASRTVAAARTPSPYNGVPSEASTSSWGPPTTARSTAAAKGTSASSSPSSAFPAPSGGRNTTSARAQYTGSGRTTNAATAVPTSTSASATSAVGVSRPVRRASPARAIARPPPAPTARWARAPSS